MSIDTADQVLSDDVAAAVAAIADRLRTKTPDQVIAIGERTGWWTPELVDWVVDGSNGPPPSGPVAPRSLHVEEQQRLQVLETQLADAGVIAVDEPTTDPVPDGGGVVEAMLLEEAAASTALDGETQVIGPPHPEPEPDLPPAPPMDAIAAPTDDGDGERPDDYASSAYVTVLQARQLGVDHTYQRPIDERRVTRMAADWDPRMVGTLDVSDRGPDEHPRYAVINGQHRALAAARVSPAGADVWLACTVHEGLDVAGEARLMHELDRTTKKLIGWDRWRARRGAGDTTVLQVDAIAARHGLRVDNDPTAMRSYGAAEKLLLLRGGEQLLDQTLAVLSAAYGDAPNAYQAPLLTGVGQLLQAHGSAVDADRLTRALRATSPERLRATAAALRQAEGGALAELMARAITGQYNRTPGNSGRLGGRS